MSFILLALLSPNLATQSPARLLRTYGDQVSVGTATRNAFIRQKQLASVADPMPTVGRVATRNHTLPVTTLIPISPSSVRTRCTDMSKTLDRPTNSAPSQCDVVSTAIALSDTSQCAPISQMGWLSRSRKRVPIPIADAGTKRLSILTASKSISLQHRTSHRGGASSIVAIQPEMVPVSSSFVTLAKWYRPQVPRSPTILYAAQHTAFDWP